jgi:hypothetical protein
VSVGADEVRQDPRVTGVGLRPRDPVAVPVAVDRKRVDGVHGVAGRDEGANQQPPVDLDADRNLRGIRCMEADHLVQPGDAADSLRHPPLGQHPAFDVDHAHVVVGLRPVDPYEDHAPSSLSTLRA